jgi:glucose-6-phosphate isomerase
LIACGIGGSISTFAFFAEALPSKKKIFIIDAPHPSKIAEIKRECNPSNAVAVVCSHSGGTLETQLSYALFKNYPKAVAAQGGKLAQVALHANIPFAQSPRGIPARFVGFTPIGLLPAKLAGMNVKKIAEGAKKMHARCAKHSPDNPALKAAFYLHQLYERKTDEIFFTPYYPLEELLRFVAQMFLESLGKEGKGVTLFSCVGPRMQHEAIQRIMGGKKNCAVITLKVAKHKRDFEINPPEDFAEFEGLSAAKIISTQHDAAVEALSEKGVPVVSIEVDELNEESCGEIIAFFQNLVYYYARMLGVSPFSNPAVLDEKAITREKLGL